MKKRRRKQLGVLRETDEILAGLRVRYWLRGGWAVDFLLGRVTRSHSDLDLVVWQRHRGRMQRALEDAGFSLDRELLVQNDLVKDGQDITFVFLERSADGSVSAHGMPDWRWRSDALPLRRHCFDGICARVVAPQQMLQDFHGYEAATGRPLRPKDAGTMETLRAIITLDGQEPELPHDRETTTGVGQPAR
ncbi:MAG: hypothetical protein R2849_07800 [Thermomicrobiales bacterium]